MKITLTKEQITRALEVANSAIARNSSRPCLEMINAVVDGNNMTFTACDGYVIAKYSLILEIDGTECFEFNFQPFQVPQDTESVDFELFANTIEITLNCLKWTQKYIMKKPDKEFIKTAHIFPETDDLLKISLNARYLKNILKPFNDVVTLSFARLGDGINPAMPLTLTSKSESITSLVIWAKEL